MKPIRIFSAVAVLIFASIACNFVTQRPATRAVPMEIPSAAAQPTEALAMLPTATSLPLYQTVTLGEKTFEDSGKGPDYTLKVVTPVLNPNSLGARGSNDPRVERFNQAVAARAQESVDRFKLDLTMQPVTPISAGSYFSLTYVLISPPGNLLSLQLHIEGYSDGAAHPYHITSSYNYDLEKGQEVTLDQLFLPGSEYLTPIANYCSNELTTRNIGFEMFSEGAKPLPENYAVWNISDKGLVITFNEYQVAAYAAGPQEVTVPFTALKDIINPQGPLNTFNP